jgi:hypothetical protein
MKMHFCPKFRAFQLLNDFIKEFMGDAMPLQLNARQCDALHKHARLIGADLTKPEYQPDTGGAE